MSIKGIEFFNEKMDQYRTDQRLLDSLNDQLEFEKSRYGKKAKGYEKLEHDLALWYFTADKRSAVVESPLDAKYWIVTLDGRLLSFDSYVTKKLGRRIPEMYTFQPCSSKCYNFGFHALLHLRRPCLTHCDSPFYQKI